MTLAFPARMLVRSVDQLGVPGKDRDSSGRDWTQQLQANILAAPICLRADIETLHYSLDQALKLRVGDLLEISASALSSMALTTTGNPNLLQGRLGQHDGKKAVLVTAAMRSDLGGVDDIERNAPDLPEIAAGAGLDQASLSPVANPTDFSAPDPTG